MNAATQITHGDVFSTLTGLVKPAPVKKARNYSRQRKIMQKAWEYHREWLAEVPNARASYRRIMFAHHLLHAHRHMFFVENPVVMTDDEIRFIGSDCRFPTDRGL